MRGAFNASDEAGLRPHRYVFAAILLIGIIGLALRFAGYSTRLFWTDESITAMRISGHSDAEYRQQFIDGKTHTVAELQRFAFYGPHGSQRQVVRSLAIEDAQHPPVYYVLAAGWTRVFGTSIGVLRLLSVLIGCLVPFAAAWSCWELYGSRLAAACGFAITSVSPILVIYSQQAREYGLWAFLIALSCAVWVRALRDDRLEWWALYAASAAAGLYTDTLFASVLASHALYAAFMVRGRKLFRFAAALSLALLAFAPWAAAIATHRRAIELSNAGTASPWPLRMMIAKWAFNVGTTFFDLEYSRWYLAAVLLPIFALIVAAVVWNLKRESQDKRMMVGALIFVPLLLFLPDLVLHQHRSTVTRYGMALWVAILVAVSGYLAAQMAYSPRRRVWTAITAAILILATASAYVDVHSRVWWDNRGDGQNVALAHVLNTAPASLVLVPGNRGRVLALSFYLNPKLTLQLVDLHQVVRPASGYSQALLLAREQEEPAYAARFPGLQILYRSSEQNAQVKSFRGSDQGLEYLSLWRFGRYAGARP